MLEHGADLNLQTRFGNLDSVLHLAISMGAFRNRNILAILMKYGASLSLKNKLGNAPLEHCLVQFNGVLVSHWQPKWRIVRLATKMADCEILFSF